MSGYVKSFNETKSMSFLIEDEKLLKKYNKIWKKVSNTMQKEFNNESVHHNGKYKTDFNFLKKLKDNNKCMCSPIALIHSDFKIDQNQYPQALLEKCTYIVKQV